MAEKPPLLCRVEFGRLAPINTAARDAIKAIPGDCRIEIKRTGANDRRRGFYWVMLDVAAESLTDRTGTPWDQETLHEFLKVKLRLGIPLKNTDGEEVGFKTASTSNRAMNEPERARWTDRCANALSHWLGCEIGELMNEARRRNGEAA